MFVGQHQATLSTSVNHERFKEAWLLSYFRLWYQGAEELRGICSKVRAATQPVAPSLKRRLRDVSGVCGTMLLVANSGRVQRVNGEEPREVGKRRERHARRR